MKSVLHILLKIWVQQFYRRNAGLFLFLFVVLFGIVQNPLMYHYKLAQGIVTSYTTLLVAFIIWLLYAGKCATFVITSIATEKMWLSELQAMDNKQIFALFTTIQMLLFLPATVYMLFTIGIGLSMQHYVAVVLLCLFLVLINGFSVALYHKRLFSNTPLQLFNKPLFIYRLPKGFFSFLLWYNLYKSKLKTIAVKFFSFFLLFIPLVWNSSYIELSDFVLFFQMSIAAHAVIVYDSAHFLERDFKVLRNMPVSLYKIFLLFIITYITLLLPEIFFLWYYGNDAHLGVSISSLIVYYIGQLLLFTALAYEKHQKMENYLLFIGLITACSLMLTPLKSFGWIGGALIIISFTLFAGNYYQYEREYSLTDEHG